MITQEDLTKEKAYWEGIKKEILDELSIIKTQFPEGAKLRVSKHGKGYQFYMREKGTERSGKYIRDKDRNIAEKLAQAEYDEKLLERIDRRLEMISSLGENTENNPYIEAIDAISVFKRPLVNTHYLSDEQYILGWLEQQYQNPGFREDAPEFITRKGLRVRSKSEVIIADILDDEKIPYLYEKPLKLKKGVVYPDFTILNAEERKEVYWEHFGMMDDIEYRNGAFLKIRNYEESGLFQHGSLIWTFETSKYPLNTRYIRNMIIAMKEKYRY